MPEQKQPQKVTIEEASTSELSNEVLGKKIDDVYRLLNQLWLQLTVSGPMSGAPILMQCQPPYTEPYTVGGTGEQQLPNQFGYRE